MLANLIIFASVITLAIIAVIYDRRQHTREMDRRKEEMKIAAITIWAHLHPHENMVSIEVEPKLRSVPLAKAIVDGLVAQGYEATVQIDTTTAEFYAGPPELTDDGRGGGDGREAPEGQEVCGNENPQRRGMLCNRPPGHLERGWRHGYAGTFWLNQGDIPKLGGIREREVFHGRPVADNPQG